VSKWIVAWIMAMAGLAGNVHAQSTRAPTKVAPASTQQSEVLANAPELRAELLEWEVHAAPDVYEEILTLRKGSAVDKGNAAYRLGGMGLHAHGAILALLETFHDRTPLEWREVGTLEMYSMSARHTDTSPAQEAAVALGRIGKSAFEPVTQALKDKDPNIRVYAAIALGKMNDKLAVKPLIEALKDEDSDVRCHAADSLGEIGDKSAVKPLIQGLKDKDSRVCGCAARSLGEIRDSSAVEALNEALKGDNRSAAIALGKIGGKSAVEALIQALQYNGLTCRLDVVSALGEAGDESAVEPLTHAMKNNPFDVDNFQYAIQKIHLRHAAAGTGATARQAAQTKTPDETTWEVLLALGILVLLFGVVGLGRFIFLKMRRAKA